MRTGGVHKPTSVFRQAIASQIGIAPVRARTPARERQAVEKPPRTSPRVAGSRHTPRSIEPRLRRPAGSSAAEAAASAHERCMDAPHRCLFRPTPAKTLDSLVALAVERFTLQLGIDLFLLTLRQLNLRGRTTFKPRQSGNPCRGPGPRGTKISGRIVTDTSVCSV